MGLKSELKKIKFLHKRVFFQTLRRISLEIKAEKGVFIIIDRLSQGAMVAHLDLLALKNFFLNFYYPPPKNT